VCVCVCVYVCVYTYTCAIESVFAVQQPGDSALRELSLAEVFLGDSKFPGLIPMIFTYLDVINCDPETRAVVDEYVSNVDMMQASSIV
jgi:hypothetical protein